VLAVSYVVTENCIRCKYQDCVEVCPVDCFHAGPDMLVIDPEECIDCSLCEPECPAEAIFAADDLPERFRLFESINRRFSAEWPVITACGEPPSDADQWKGIPGKLEYLALHDAGQ
jgi:ferredoxin